MVQAIFNNRLVQSNIILNSRAGARRSVVKMMGTGIVGSLHSQIHMSVHHRLVEWFPPGPQLEGQSIPWI